MGSSSCSSSGSESYGENSLCLVPGVAPPLEGARGRRPVLSTITEFRWYLRRRHNSRQGGWSRRTPCAWSERELAHVLLRPEDVEPLLGFVSQSRRPNAPSFGVAWEACSPSTQTHPKSRLSTRKEVRTLLPTTRAVLTAASLPLCMVRKPIWNKRAPNELSAHVFYSRVASSSVIRDVNFRMPCHHMQRRASDKADFALCAAARAFLHSARRAETPVEQREAFLYWVPARSSSELCFWTRGRTSVLDGEQAL